MMAFVGVLMLTMGVAALVGGVIGVQTIVRSSLPPLLGGVVGLGIVAAAVFMAFVTLPSGLGALRDAAGAEFAHEGVIAELTMSRGHRVPTKRARLGEHTFDLPLELEERLSVGQKVAVRLTRHNGFLLELQMR